MKNYFIQNCCGLFLLTLLFLQQGCVKDTCTQKFTYTYFQPLYKTTAEARANIKSNAPRAIVHPGKIFIKGNYIFLNEINKGIHVINNSNPSAPANAAFIDIPGNVDIAVKNNILYADFYTDLVAMDISNPLNISVVKIMSNVFPERFYYEFNADSNKIIYEWVKKTETVQSACDGNDQPGIMEGMLFNSMDAGLSSSSAAGTPTGISGSLARFAIISNYMYAVSQHSLRVIQVAEASNPLLHGAISLGWGIETIYPFKDKLFIGSNTGMFIYGLQNPQMPVMLGSFNHVTTCDPVIADDNYAYVTLHSGTQCQGFTNQLDILNITNIQSPQLIKSYPLTSPRGLSKDGNLLFICDGRDGLKIFNAADPAALIMVKQFLIQDASDVIAYNGIALVVAGDGLYQYDYSNPADIKLLSKMPVQL